MNEWMIENEWMTKNAEWYLAIATRASQSRHCRHSPSSSSMNTGGVQKDSLLICLIRDSFIKKQKQNVALKEFLKWLNKALSLPSQSLSFFNQLFLTLSPQCEIEEPCISLLNTCLFTFTEIAQALILKTSFTPTAHVLGNGGLCDRDTHHVCKDNFIMVSGLLKLEENIAF